MYEVTLAHAEAEAAERPEQVPEPGRSCDGTGQRSHWTEVPRWPDGGTGGERPAWCSTLTAVAKLGTAELNAMIAEATVDAHDEDEQVSGFYNILEEELTVPFETTVLGFAVMVEGIGLTSRGITATCVRGKYRQAISVLDLPLPEPPPAGWEWIAAYRHWAH